MGAPGIEGYIILVQYLYYVKLWARKDICSVYNTSQIVTIWYRAVPNRFLDPVRPDSFLYIGNAERSCKDLQTDHFYRFGFHSEAFGKTVVRTAILC